MNVLVINCGSSSIKYQVVDTQHETDLVSGNIDRIGIDIDYDEAMRRLLADVAPFRLDAVGHRVVHGGDRFRNSVKIDDDVIQSISDCCKLAPLHNPRNLDGILATRKAFPDLPQVAVFDTAFHATIPEAHYSYALPAELIHKHGIRRYGFHGTSHHYVALKAAEALGRPLNELQLISLHLGNGASACAIEFGHSVETSMGMTPLEGLVMGTRSGDLDPGALLFLMREEGLSLDATDTLLNKKSGLSGLSGLSPDLRELEKAAIDGHAGARLAISAFVHRVRKYLGAYLATLGGADAVILTGGIGENSASMRQRILQRMSYAGLLLDEHANNDLRLSASHPVEFISTANSRLQALVIRTNEELMIAKETRSVLESANTLNVTNLAIPIAVSARHVHLTKDAFEQLFGANAELSRYKDLSQPGQFASGQTVNLIGPRNRIDSVRILGPFRSKNQVEISRTDEFFLGIDAPIRDSGRTEGSAPITLEGPQGTLHLAEGLICARRHIHMHPDDARTFGVANLDEVEVAITGGPRDLVFQDVSVRVSPQFRLEMHLDTDEANAAELNSGTEGELVYTEQKQVSGQILRKRPLPVSAS
jgi:acetate kinase